MYALLALVLLLLGLVVLPLGLETAAHYRSDYAEATLGQARALAGVAEESLSDREADPTLRHDLLRYVGSGQGVVLLDASGMAVDSAGIHFTVPAGLASTVHPRTAHLRSGDEGLIASAVPIGTLPGRVGVVVLARPTEPLDTRIRTLWLTLGAAAVVAALVAVVLAGWLSRWVTRPLRRLEDAAHSVGAGNLDTRAAVSHGPPEVRRVAAAFDTMAARLTTLLHGQRAVIADVSHQLRTPISALRLRLELLPERDVRDQEALSGALDEVNRLSRLVDGLLAVARAEATTEVPSPVDAREVIAERVSAWAPLAAERGVDLTLVAGPAVRAWAVPDQLDQILDNLLANCFDLEPAPGHVRLSVVSSGDEAVVTVADDGPGMPGPQRAIAFERFATGHADTGGTGLGLPIVHRIVTAVGGRVSLAETPGGGLTVTFSLPRVVSGYGS
jgi:signal transduction histidine kinase